MSAFNFGRSGSADGRDVRSFAPRGASRGAAGSGAPSHRRYAHARRGALGAGLLALTAFALLAVLPATASATDYTQGTTLCTTGTEADQCEAVKSVAVDQSTGMIYALDTGNLRVDQFEPDGTFVRAWGFAVDTESNVFQVCTTASTCRKGTGTGATTGSGSIAGGGRGIAVDPNTHIVYVTTSNTTLSLYDGTTGAYIGTVTSGGAPEGPTLAAGLAVDTSDPGQHYLWVNSNVTSGGVQHGRSVLNKFEVAGPGGTPALTYVCQITGTEAASSANGSECPSGPSKDGIYDGIRAAAPNSEGVSQPGGNVAVDGNGDVFIAEALGGTVDRQTISQFDTDGLFVNQFKPDGFGGNPRPEGIAATPGGNVFAAVGGAAAGSGGAVIQEFDPASPATPVSEFGSGIVGGSYGVAVDVPGFGGPASFDGTVYVGDNAGKTVLSFTPDGGTEFPLTIATDGDGTGAVECEVDGGEAEPCADEYPEDTELTLVAVPDNDSSFGGWAGDCTVDPCELTMTEAKSVTATFDLKPTFDLTITIDGDGDGTVECEVDGGEAEACEAEYPEGAELELVAAEGANSVFAGFSAGTGSAAACTTSPCAFTITTDSTVTATFDLEQRLLSVAKDGDGDGTVQSFPVGVDCGLDCDEEYDHGTVVTLSQTPDGSSEFDGWAGCDELVAGDCEVTMTEAKNVTATFSPEGVFALTITKAGDGDGTIECDSGSGFGACAPTYTDGETISVKAEPDGNSAFAGFSAGTGSAAACTTSPCTFDIEEASSVTATFNSTMRALTVTKAGTGDGTIECEIDSSGTPGACAAGYPNGSSVKVIAAPDGNSAFAGFSAGTGSAAACTTSPCTFDIEADSTLTATFDPAPRTLAVTKAGAGDGTITCKLGAGAFEPCAPSYPHGSSIQVAAAPDAASVFAGFSAGTGSAAACTTSPCAFTITTDSTVTATFNVAQRTLTINKAGAGDGSFQCDSGSGFGACAASYPDGTTITIAATPDANSTFSGWSGGGCSGTGDCVISNIAANTTVTGTFAVALRTLTVTKDGEGTGTVLSTPAGIECGATCVADYTHGTDVTLVATPGAKTAAAVWSGCDDINASNHCLIEMDADATVEVSFEIETFLLSVSKPGTGSGTVTSAPAGIDCGSACSALYEHSTEIELSAVAAPGSEFVMWTGACSGSGACEVTLDSARTVSAIFDSIPLAVPEIPIPTCETDPSLCPPKGTNPAQVRKRCVTKANKVRKRAVKAAKARKGKARGRAMRVANKRKARAVKRCNRAFQRQKRG
jgi:hypothetical protein